MIAELKEAIDILEQDAISSSNLIKGYKQIFTRFLHFLEAQEARLQKWEVREKCKTCRGIELPCTVCDFQNLTTRPATFDDVMDWMNYYFSVEGMEMPLPDGRELRRKT